MRVVAFVLLLLSGGPTLACSCVRTPSPLRESVASEFEFADAVVLARAVRVEVDETDSTRASETQTTTFKTVRFWKGDIGPVFQTRIVMVCGMVFMPGERYLLYLRHSDDAGYLSVSMCSRTAELRKAARDIEVLDRIAPAQVPVATTSPEASASPDVH